MGIKILNRYFYIQMSGGSELNWKHDTNVDHFPSDIYGISVVVIALFVLFEQFVICYSVVCKYEKHQGIF